VSAEELVDRALARMGSVNHWMSVPELRALDEVKAILGAPDDLRRDCVIELAERSVGLEWSSHARQLLPVAARKRLPLSAAEVYLLTPAERQTRVYSNRFAGHVFRQVQARALMKGRGWKPVAVAWWDGDARRRPVRLRHVGRQRPEWLDRGEGRRFENYWTSFAFGELAEAGKVRRPQQGVPAGERPRHHRRDDHR